MDRLRPVELPAGAEVGEELGVELLDPEDQVRHLVGDAVHISAKIFIPSRLYSTLGSIWA